MVQALALAPHLTTDELEAAARSCEDGDLRTRIEAIRLVSLDWQLTDIGEALGRTRGWVAVEWLLLPAVNIVTFNIALAHFAEAVGAGENRRIILVLDGAGWHKSKDVEWPVGVHPLFLPAYSPELQPAEKLWPLVREATANRFIDDLDDLEQIVVDRCRVLLNTPAAISGHTRFSWWPTDTDQ